MWKEVLQNELLDNESRLTCWRGQHSLFTGSALSWIAKFPSRTSEVIEPQRHLWGAKESFLSTFQYVIRRRLPLVCCMFLRYGHGKVVRTSHLALYSKKKKMCSAFAQGAAFLQTRSISIINRCCRCCAHEDNNERNRPWKKRMVRHKLCRHEAQSYTCPTCSTFFFFLEVDWFRFLLDIVPIFLVFVPTIYFTPPPYLIV